MAAASIPLSPLTQKKLDTLFTPEDRPEAARLLTEECATTLSMWRGTQPADFDRIRLAVIKLSKGNLAALQRQIEGAHSDWRDTLMAAGFGEDIHAHLDWNPDK